MSAQTRSTLAEMRVRYARAFDLDLDEVQVEEWPDEEGCVYAPDHPELPKWTTGKPV